MIALCLFIGDSPSVNVLTLKIQEKVLFNPHDFFFICVWQPLGEAVVGKEMAAKITFTNPLPRTLKGVVFRVEGLGLQKGHEVVVG